MLNSIFNENIDVLSLLVSIITSLILGFIIALTTNKTSNNSKNFLITITMLPVLVMSVMIMVNGNLGTSVAILGAFSLVRFRSIPGTSREILIVFFAMSIGLATGMGQIYYAILLTIVGCLTLVGLNKLNIFDGCNNEKILKVVIPENLDYEDIFKEEFEKYTTKVIPLKTKTTNMGSLFEITYKIMFKDNVKEKEFIDDIRVKNGNLKVLLSHEINDGDL